jgi:hypothetical protein
MNYIRFKHGFKYQLYVNYEIKINICPVADIITHYINLTIDGVLLIKKGYAWDGPSGPAIDTLNFMRGSLVHDALYQLIRRGYLSELYRKHADVLLKQMCKEDGMSSLRAWWVYNGVRFGGKYAADPSSKKRIIRAPK